jgi:hypothetical protein
MGPEVKRALEVAAKILCFGPDGEDCDMCVAAERDALREDRDNLRSHADRRSRSRPFS